METLPENVTVVDHPIVRVRLSALRSAESKAPEFRHTLRDLAVLVGLSAMRSLPTVDCEVQTPLAACRGDRFLRPIVLVPVLRAGLGMAEALLDLVPEASVGHVGLARDEVTFEPRSYYFKAPPLSDADVFLVDPMVATGQSAADAVDRVRKAGARRVSVIGLIGSGPGVANFARRHPDVPVFLAVVDPDLNDKAYIVPGLGDAGDRYFGT